jgi:two-component system, OmpR family, KDP operon response regulator KdpE
MQKIYIMTKSGILIIDDEPQIRKLLTINLESNQYNVQQASTGKEGLLKAANHPPDLILLDLGLPDVDGHTILKELRQWYNNPVIILSVIDREEDIVKALDNGAADYLTKPFRTGELLARIRSAIRHNSETNIDEPISCGKLEIDLSARLVKKENVMVKLTNTEFNLLALFARNEGKVLTHQFLLRAIWGVGFQDQTQYLRVFVAQLRKKIEDDPNVPRHIVTESGVGYRFC